MLQSFLADHVILSYSASIDCLLLKLLSGAVILIFSTRHDCSDVVQKQKLLPDVVILMTSYTKKFLLMFSDLFCSKGSYDVVILAYSWSDSGTVFL